MNTPVYKPTCDLPPGFRASGVHAGIKADPAQYDMALLVSDVPDTSAAGMFTTNRIQAAPVKLDREKLQSGYARAVVTNSGNANACTGPQGMADAERMCALTAEGLDVEETDVLVCSTGSIGKPLVMDPIENGIPHLISQLTAAGGSEAAKGILTTDTRPKECSTEIIVDGKTVTLSGFCKGAGMIEPNMATMLAYVCTDAVIDPEPLKRALRVAVDASFNRISIDGDTSTNDTVLMFANGQAGHATLTSDHPDWRLFQTALNGLVFELAMKIVWDGEGMTKFIELRAEGCETDADADRAVRAVANSFLVKTGWAGTYPAWSRIVDVLGYCGINVNPDAITILYNDLPVLENSVPSAPNPDKLDPILASNRYTITFDAGTGGDGSAVLYTCDCTEEYVRINMF